MTEPTDADDLAWGLLGLTAVALVAALCGAFVTVALAWVYLAGAQAGMGMCGG